jgi:predicted transposase YbfD/YdcC
MIVKENHPTLRATLELLLDSPVAARVPCRRRVEREKGHGRIERRELVSSSVLAGRLDWPGMAQIFRVKRQRQQVKTGKQEEETVYGITSLSAKQAGPRKLLKYVRGHWAIENRSHHVRDVTFDEDRSQVRCGNTPQVMAALRNTAIGLLRLAGHRNIAAACRYYAANPWHAVALLGGLSEN